MPPKTKFDREQIIEAAVKIVREYGFEKLSARTVGDELNCSVCPVFKVFKNMDELKAEVISRVKAEYNRYVIQGLESRIPFKGVGEQYIKFAFENPNFFKLLFMSEEDVKSSAAVLPVLDENYDKILNSITDSYGLGQKEAQEIYMHLFVYTHGIATLSVTGVYKFSAEEIDKSISDIFIGLLKNLGVRK